MATAAPQSTPEASDKKKDGETPRSGAIDVSAETGSADEAFQLFVHDAESPVPPPPRLRKKG